MKSILLALSLLAIFSGCSDTSEKKETTKKVSDAVAPKIEIVQNENAREIKVQKKKSEGAENKSYYLGYNVKSKYDENAMPANEDASVRVKPRTQIEANMYVRSPYEKIQVSMMARKLSKKFIVKCSACHNDYANGIIGPSLIGRDADYIYNKISEFKSGKKSNPLMNDLIKIMDDKEIREIADEIFNFNKELKKMRGE